MLLSTVMNMAGPIAAFIVIFSVVVVVHEAGHYLAAKWCRVPISEFSLGFPGTLVVMTLGRYRETAFTIRLLPFGGFVRFGNAGYPEDDGAVFDGLLPSHKAVILVAGSLFNLFTGFLLLVAALMAVRGLGLIDSSKAALELMGQVVSETFSALVYLNFHGVIGPVGAAVVASEVMKQGLWPMVGFAGLMSFSVGIMNLLPVPGFDGWHVVLAGIEAVRGKPFNGRFHALAGAAGFVVIVVLMVAVTFLDVTSIHDVINITCTTR